MRDFKLEILRNNIPIGKLKCRSCTIKFDSTAAVKRGLQATISADATEMYPIQTQVRDYIYFDGTRYFNNTWCFVNSIIDYETLTFDMFSDRLRAVLIEDGQEYPIGQFMIMNAPETYAETGNHYSIEAYDETMLLKQAALTDRAYYAKNTSYQTIIEGLLRDCNFVHYIIDQTNAKLAISREFEIGTTYLDLINTLLAELNYNPVYQGANGTVYITKKAVKNTADFVYRDQLNVFNLIGTIEEAKDVYSKPNVIVGVLSNPQQDPIVYKRENNDPGSVVSIPRRGYKVVKVIKLSNVASTSVLHEYVDAELFNAMQTTETVKFNTLIEAGHDFGSTVQISTNLIEGLYTETAWTIDISINSMRMQHKAERRIFV